MFTVEMPRLALLPIAIAACGGVGCASKPVAYVGLYGSFEDKKAPVLAIVEPYAASVTNLEVEPPAGVATSVIIHGSSSSAQTAAKELAYSLYLELGEWIAVRPIEVTNHTYSADFIGIYLLDSEYASDVLDEAGIGIVAMNQYISIACDNFQVILHLAADHRFSIAGSAFDDNDKESLFALRGTYHSAKSELTLRAEGRDVRFRKDTVQWESEPVERTLWIPLSPEEETVFACRFLQDLEPAPTTSAFH